MKRMLALLLIAAMMLALGACVSKQETRVNPISFFYKNREVSFDSEYGVVYPLAVDLDDRNIAIAELISRYLEGPDEDFLECPFPPGTVLYECTWIDGLLTIILSNEFASLSTLDLTIAMGCLTMTMTQIEGVDAVIVDTVDKNLSFRKEPMTPEDFVFLVQGNDASETTVHLYFSDYSNRYLLLDSRTVHLQDAESLPMVILNELLQGPSGSNLFSVLPAGTKVLDVQINDGVCMVDFSSHFFDDRPKSALKEHLVVYSVVNTLTELENVDAVQFLVEGQRMGQYVNLDLSQPIYRDETAVGPIRSSLNEFDATIYLYSEGSELLVGVPMRLRSSASQTVAEAALLGLIEANDRAGLTNPIPAGTTVNSVVITESLCSVDFSKEFLNASRNRIAEQNAVRAVVATMCRLSGVRRVQITIDGAAEGLKYHDISSPLVSQFRWSAD